MAKKIIVKVDTKEGMVCIKRGHFGSVSQYSGGWYTDNSINEMVSDFCAKEVRRFEHELSKVIKK